MAKYEESVDKKISRKTAREWRKDLMKRSLRDLPDPHREGEPREGAAKRFYEAKEKFRGLKNTPLGIYLGKGKELKGGGRAVMKSGGKVK